MPWSIKNWDDMRFLLAVHKSGTMTAAAKSLDSNVATVSRRIEKMRETLGYPPFIKTATGWETNKRLDGLLHVLEGFDATLNQELSQVLETDDVVRVPLRIGLPPVIASLVLYPTLGDAMPSLSRVGLEFFDRFWGEGLGENDIVIQASRPETGRVISRRIGQINFSAFSSPSGSDDWVGLSREYDAYPAMQLGHATFGREPLIRTIHFEHVLEIAKATGLQAVLPNLMAMRAPDLTLMPGPNRATEFWVMYHASRRSDPAIRAVVHWIEQSFLAASSA